MQAVSAFIATSNHEFNNALFISNGLLRKLSKHDYDREESLSCIQRIISVNERMEKVVKRLGNLKEIEFQGYSKDNDKIIPMLKVDD